MEAVNMSATVQFPIKELLKFYDDPPAGNGRHMAAVTSVIGEDMGAGLLVDYFQRQGYKADVINQIVTQGTNKGKRLDRWIDVRTERRETYYQVEIKKIRRHLRLAARDCL